MNIINRRKPPVIIRIGLVCMFLATGWRVFGPHFEGSFIDAVTGFLYGLSIACLLMGLYKNRSCTRP